MWQITVGICGGDEFSLWIINSKYHLQERNVMLVHKLLNLAEKQWKREGALCGELEPTANPDDVTKWPICYTHQFKTHWSDASFTKLHCGFSTAYLAVKVLRESYSDVVVCLPFSSTLWPSIICRSSRLDTEVLNYSRTNMRRAIDLPELLQTAINELSLSSLLNFRPLQNFIKLLWFWKVASNYSKGCFVRNGNSAHWHKLFLASNDKWRMSNKSECK